MKLMRRLLIALLVAGVLSIAEGQNATNRSVKAKQVIPLSIRRVPTVIELVPTNDSCEVEFITTGYHPSKHVISTVTNFSLPKGQTNVFTATYVGTNWVIACANTNAVGLPRRSL